MKLKRYLVVFDAADMDAESAFWAALLDGTVEKAHDDWRRIIVEGEYRLAVQLAPDHVPPDWPDGSPQQIHLDLHVEELGPAHDKAMALGARLLQPADDVSAEVGWQVYADPAGHPFCLCWG